MMTVVLPDSHILMVLCPSRLPQRKGQRSIDYFGLVAETFQVPMLTSEKSGLSINEIDVLLGQVVSLANEIKPLHVLVAGGYLEDDVTVFCLEALAQGFDVFIMADSVVARDAKFQNIQLQRLFQAGVVPATLNQFLYQWTNQIEDKLMQETVKLKLAIT
jgi:Isochorismatase family